MDQTWLLERMLLWIPLVLSLTVHEWAHAWSANLLGDRTAEFQGRLTLNPLAHIDPVGTLILPLLGIPFGWAKPVPINPALFHRDISMRMGVLIVAAAGPISNFLIALVAALGLAYASSFPAFVSRFGYLLPTWQMLVILNAALAVFNLIPVPPLDGSRIVDAMMPDRLRPLWDRFAQAGPFILLAIILLPALVGISLLALPARYLLDWLGSPM